MLGWFTSACIANVQCTCRFLVFILCLCLLCKGKPINYQYRKSSIKFPFSLESLPLFGTRNLLINRRLPPPSSLFLHDQNNKRQTLWRYIFTIPIRAQIYIQTHELYRDIISTSTEKNNYRNYHHDGNRLMYNTSLINETVVCGRSSLAGSSDNIVFC